MFEFIFFSEQEKARLTHPGLICLDLCRLVVGWDYWASEISGKPKLRDLKAAAAKMEVGTVAECRAEKRSCIVAERLRLGRDVVGNPYELW